MKQLKLSKGHMIYKEGQISLGIYVLFKGTVNYMKNVQYRQPIGSKTKNKWFIE